MMKPMWKKGVCAVGFLLLVGMAHAGQRFTDNGDGTVTDNQLGVMWSKSDNQGDIGWKAAQAYATYTFGYTITKPYDNWRLPTLDELQSLYVTETGYEGYTTNCGIPVRITPEIRLSCVLVWSSDSALGSHLAYNFNIGNSFSVPAYDIAGCRVLSVRNLE